MKRRYVLPTLAILIAPLVIGSSPLLASDGDSREGDHGTEVEDENETAQVPTTSVPRREREHGSDKTTLPPTSKPGTVPSQSPPPSEANSETSTVPSAPTVTLPRQRRSSTTAPAGSIAIVPNDDSDNESEDHSDEDSTNDSSDNSPSDSSDDGSQSGRRFEDLAKNIVRAINGLNALPVSEARDAALGSLQALQVRLDAGEVIPVAEVRAVFAQVAALVYDRVGDDSGDDVIPEIGHVPDDQQLPRMVGSVTEALRLLDGNSSESALAAIAALQAVKSTLDGGILPEHDVFEAAMDLAKDALKDQPTARASMTLAGVIAAVEASKVPDDVKAQLLVVLRAVQEQVLNNPAVDARQIVRDALRQVRDARIASAVARIVAIIERLETQANELGNADALLLLAQARSIVQPADGLLPTRDQLHEARHILHKVIDLLTPEIPPTTTVPETTVPETTVPETSVPETSVPEPTTVAI